MNCGGSLVQPEDRADEGVFALMREAHRGDHKLPPVAANKLVPLRPYNKRGARLGQLLPWQRLGLLPPLDDQCASRMARRFPAESKNDIVARMLDLLLVSITHRMRCSR